MRIRYSLTYVYPFKGINGICAVANSVQEAAEVMRIGRSVMYSRNKKMQKLGQQFRLIFIELHCQQVS